MSKVSAIFPPSRAQLGMLVEILAGSDALHVEQLALSMTGPIDSVILAKAWSHLVATHETLRTCVVVQGVRDPVCCVIGSVRASIDEISLPHNHEAWLEEDRRRRFDLEKAPLARLTLLQGNGEYTVLVLTYSHLILDGWSVRLLVTELQHLYRRLSAGDETSAPIPNSLASVRAHLARVDAEAREWLRGHLAHVKLATRPYGTTSEVSGEGHHEVSRLPDSTEARTLADATRRHGVSFAIWVQAAWTILLQHKTGAQRVVYGVTATARPPEVDGIESAVGMLVGTVPVVVERALTVAALLANVRAISLNLPGVASVAGGDVAALMGWPAGLRLYESVIVSQQSAGVQERAGPLPNAGVTASGARTQHALLILISGADVPEIRLIGRHKHYDVNELSRILDDLFAVMLTLASLSLDDPPEGATRSLRDGSWETSPLPAMQQAPSGSMADRLTRDVVTSVWETVFGQAMPEDGRRVVDLAISSLALVHLKARIEQALGIELSLAEIVAQPSLEDIVATVDRARSALKSR